MYSFFDLSSTKTARVMAATGALIITVILMAGAIIPAAPAATTNTVFLTTGVLA
ncbi:MAG: hypothetical protein ABJ205_12715 [Erythrobacter sp.]|uniref:hypothetical protein n=1 Tax=Erythrobacter sp. TaxID=1042 RepID=UPI003266DA61